MILDINKYRSCLFLFPIFLLFSLFWISSLIVVNQSFCALELPRPGHPVCSSYSQLPTKGTTYSYYSITIAI